MRTYVGTPKNTSGPYKAIVIFFSDVFGIHYINNQLLVDYYASNGFLVVGPDYFWGDKLELRMKKDPTFVPPNPKFDEWTDIYQERSFKVLPQWLDAVRQKYGTSNTKYGVIGYCFGAV